MGAVQIGLFPHDGRTRQVSTAEEHDVYAGRPRTGRPEDVPIGAEGWLGNPYRVTEAGDALEMFRVHFLRRVANGPLFRRAVLALKGKRLGCPGCATGAPCHARIIAEWIEAQSALPGTALTTE